MSDRLAARVTLTDGGTATVLELAPDGRVRLTSSRPHPPGSTLVGTLTEANEAGVGLGVLQVKVRGCRRAHAGVEEPFEVDGRAVNLTRALRDALTSS